MSITDKKVCKCKEKNTLYRDNFGNMRCQYCMGKVEVAWMCHYCCYIIADDEYQTIKIKYCPECKCEELKSYVPIKREDLIKRIKERKIYGVSPLSGRRSE